jgi:hypothetical protein
MPLLKRSYCRLDGVDSGAIQSLAARLKKLSFSLNSDIQTLGVDAGRDSLGLEFAVRRKQQGQVFSEAEQKFVTATGYDYKRHYFELDGRSHIAATPGGFRDFKLLAAALKGAGATAVEPRELTVDVAGWARDLLKHHDSAQLAAIVIEDFYSEDQQKLIGRYSAKSLDNRLEPGMLKPDTGSLKSLRLAYFEEGARKSVEVRANGVLSLTCSDEEELAQFLDEQRGLMLSHSSLADEA